MDLNTQSGVCAEEHITWVSSSISLKHFLLFYNPPPQFSFYYFSLIKYLYVNKFCIQESLEHQETFSFLIILSMRNLP